MTANEIEKAVVKAFIVPGRRARYIEALVDSGSKKKRDKVLARFDHNAEDFDSRYRHQIPADKQSPCEIEATLRSRGAPERCHVISTWTKYDRREMLLSDALESLVGQGMGSVISCIPGQLAYFESEEAGERYVLERTV